MMKNFFRVIFLFSVFLCFCFFYASADTASKIVLKLLVANPSKEYSQKVPVKAYLPKETKPEDVLDKADLEVAYDTQQGSYYVYGDYDLQPSEVLEKEIEIRDIWSIPERELSSLRVETDKLSALLNNTEFAERVDFLKQSIDSKLGQIDENQKNAPVNPERHISDYRDNLRILEAVKADLALARNLVSQAKPFSIVIVWKLIIIIISFLGVLGGAFYIFWQKQVRFVLKQELKTSKEASRESSDKKEENKFEDRINKI